MDKKVYIEPDGCNRRQLDLHRVRDYLVANDYILVDSPQTANYILLSTCAFKKMEEERSVARIRALRRYDARMLVYGCLPDIAPEKFKEFREIPKIAPKELHTIDEFFEDVKVPFAEVKETNVLSAVAYGSLRTVLRRVTSTDLSNPEFYSQALDTVGRRLRAIGSKKKPDYYLFICRGCLGHCTYCGIRRAIGTVRSKPAEVVLEEFRNGLQQGYQTFSILGDDPGCYGLEIGSSLPELLELLQQECRHVREQAQAHGEQSPDIGFHIKEIHPKFVIRYAEDLAAVCSSGITKSILCPLQSGNDRVLGLMRREHTADGIRQALGAVREANPDINLTTQIIVGFPTETDEEFQDTLHAVRQIGFSSVVVFPYDDKDHTRSARINGKIPPRMINERVRQAFRFFNKAGIKANLRCA